MNLFSLIRCDHNAASWFNEMPESNPFMTSNTVNDEGSYVPVLDNVTTQRINDKWHCPFDLPLHDLLNDDIVDDVCSKSFPTEATSSEAISHPNESCDTEKFSQNSNTLSHIPITDILSTQAFSPELNVKPLATKVCDETTVGKNNDYEYEYASTFLGDSTATVSKEPNVNRNVIMNYSRDSDIDGDDQHLKSRSTVITGEDVFLCPSYQLNLPYFIPISLSNALEPCEVLDKANNSDVILASHTPPNLVQEVQVPRSECVETESQLTTVFRRGHNVASDQGEIILDEAINDSQSAIQGISNQYIPYISQTNVKPNEKIAPVRDKGSNGDRSVPDILETYCKSDSDLPFNDQNPNEEFYSNTNCIKTGKLLRHFLFSEL